MSDFYETVGNLNPLGLSPEALAYVTECGVVGLQRETFGPPPDPTHKEIVILAENPTDS